MPKGAKNDSTIKLNLLYPKNGSKKHPVFEKWEHFENSQNWPRGKGYRLCKIATLGQKLKMPKRCEKLLLDLIKDVVLKKPLQKHLLLEKSEQFENGQSRSRCMGYSPCKMLSLGQKLKMPKRWEKRFYNHTEVVVCKKLLPKTPNSRKMRAFWKWPNLATT